MLTEKHLCWNLFLIKLQLYERETPAQVSSFEYCDIFDNSFFYRAPVSAASEIEFAGVAHPAFSSPIPRILNKIYIFQVVYFYKK